ncbi:hypothetical protein GCM10017607_01190 [Microbacterium thalassium]|nr:hypothetical protein GCM10017607_01190 [Microbacterium thalassium]
MLRSIAVGFGLGELVVVGVAFWLWTDVAPWVAIALLAIAGLIGAVFGYGVAIAPRGQTSPSLAAPESQRTRRRRVRGRPAIDWLSFWVYAGGLLLVGLAGFIILVVRELLPPG